MIGVGWDSGRRGSTWGEVIISEEGWGSGMRGGEGIDIAGGCGRGTKYGTEDTSEGYCNCCVSL